MLNGAARKAYERSREARRHGARPVVLRVTESERHRRRRHKRLFGELPRVHLAIVSDDGRPRTRADCANVPRPCPYVSCRHHLYLDVRPGSGSLKLPRPDLEPDELADSCSLDIADEGGTTMETVAGLLNLTRERVRQIEDAALLRIAPLLEAFDPTAEDE